jgi:hypothetical protein
VIVSVFAEIIKTLIWCAFSCAEGSRSRFQRMGTLRVSERGPICKDDLPKRSELTWRSIDHCPTKRRRFTSPSKLFLQVKEDPSREPLDEIGRGFKINRLSFVSSAVEKWVGTYRGH